jgi:hypothetical protein
MNGGGEPRRPLGPMQVPTNCFSFRAAVLLQLQE